MSNDDTVLVTVVVPSFRGAPWVPTCLKSLLAQRLERAAFEVIVVVNGEPDNTPAIVDEILGSDPTFQYRVVFEDRASLSHARNTGIRLARGNWVTWVDVDDWISPDYLAELVGATGEHVVPLARVVDVDAASGEHRMPPISQAILDFPAGVVDPVELTRPLAFAACKLLPTRLARQSLFATTLRSGEDVAYFARFMAEHALSWNTSPAHRGATYYRLVRPGSMSRQAPSYQFSVNERIAVMRHLDDAARTVTERYLPALRSLINAQAAFITRYLHEVPSDFPRVRTDLSKAGLLHTPWQHIRSRTPNLAVLYHVAPYLPLDETPGGRHLADSEEHWNVIGNELSGTDRAFLTASSAISRHELLPQSHTTTRWATIEDFCSAGLAALRRLEEASGPQRTVYSSGTWPAPHFLAALLKVRRGADVEWTADLTYPVARDAGGAPRRSDPTAGGLHDELSAALRARGLPDPPSASLFEWGEHVAIALADRLVVGSHAQLEEMLSHLPDAWLARTVRTKSTITP